MSDVEVILRKIDSIQNCIQRIGKKTQDNPKWMTDLDAQDVVVLNLTRAVQLCIDIASSVIVQEKWGLAKNLADSFVILGKNQVISPALVEKMKKMVGFRNIATHTYKEINYDIVNAIIHTHLRDIEEFYTAALQYYRK